MTKESDDKQAKFEAWIASRPPLVQAAIRAYDPLVCYRSSENRGHYVIYSFEEHGENLVTVSLIHGTDSYLPGVRVFGVSLVTLQRCACGQWEYPTAEQTERTRSRIEALAAKRRCQS